MESGVNRRTNIDALHRFIDCVSLFLYLYSKYFSLLTPYKRDIWSLGVIALELAEGPKIESPFLKQPDRWSPAFVDFVSKCLQKLASMRPTASELF